MGERLIYRVPIFQRSGVKMALDTGAVLWGYSALWIAIISGLLAYCLWNYGKKFGVGTGFRKLGTLLLAGVCVFSFVTMAGISLTGEEASIGGTSATYEVTMAESEGQTAVDNNKMEIDVHCNFNYAGGVFRFGTGNFSVNFTLDRTDSGTTTDVATLECTDIDIVANHGGGDDVAIVTETDEYQIDWTKAVDPDATAITTTTHTGLTATLSVEAGGAGWCLLNVSLAATAVDLMVPYVVEHITFEIAGIEVVANIQVTTYLGTAPT